MTNPIIKRGTIRNIVGVEVDELSMSLLCNADTTFAGVPLAQFARQGGFDGAKLELSRTFYPAYGANAAGSLKLFTGRVGPLTISGTEIQMSVKSTLEILDIAMPRNIYMAQCQHTLYDTGCTINPASYTSTGNTTAGSTALKVNCNLAQADGYFELGVMKYISGNNNQQQRSVRIHANGSLTPMQPFGTAPAAGDLFTIRPGCDKSLDTCTVKFNNKANARMYPFIPAPETTF